MPASEYTEQDRANEGCCWDYVRQLCPGGGCLCDCHATTEQILLSSRATLRRQNGELEADNGRMMGEISRQAARIAALEAERDALVEDNTALRWENGDSYDTWPLARLREPEYFKVGDRELEKTAVCRCCDASWAWSYVSPEGYCLHCVDGRAGLRTERDAIQAAWNRDKALLNEAIDHHLSRWKRAEARLAAAEAALKGVCGKLVQPGEEFFSEHTEKGWREFLLTHRREIGRPLNSRDSVLARMAYLSGFMGGAQSGAYLLYVHHLTRAGSREQATGEGE